MLQVTQQGSTSPESRELLEGFCVSTASMGLYSGRPPSSLPTIQGFSTLPFPPVVQEFTRLWPQRRAMIFS